MPRQRKPQNGGQRLGTGRVANTTTSSNLQTVYRVPARGAYGECEKLAYEVIGTSPIEVHIEGDNIYRVSINPDSLQGVIEDMDLSLSNVTLDTINGNVTFTGDITAEGALNGSSISATEVSATTGNISTLTGTSATITNISATDISTATLEASGNASVGGDLAVTGSETVGGNLGVTGTLDVDGDVDFDGNLVVDGTAHIGGDVSMGEDLTVTGATTTDSISAVTGTITTLSSDAATIGTLEVTNTTTLDGTLSVAGTSTMADINAANVRASGTLAVTGTSSFIGDVTMNNVTSTGTANLNDVTVGGNESIAGTLAVAGATTVNNTLTVSGASTLGGTTSVGGNLSVAGNQAVSGTSTVSGNAMFSQNVSITGNENLTGNLIVDGDVEFKGNVDVDSDLNIDGTTHMGGSANVDHVLTVGETLTLGTNATAPQFILQSEKNQANGVAALNASGKIDESVLPPLAIGETFVVSSEAQMLALVAQTGDRAIRTDESKTYVKLNSNNPSSLSDWQVLLSSGEVISVNGQTGAVVLDADDISDLATTNKFVTAADKANWNAKEDVSNKDTATLVDSTTHYPSSHVMIDKLATKQETLVNQQNIKSINNQSLLGSGNLTITANVDFYYEQTTQGATTYTLQHTPISNNSVMVFTDSGTALFPMIDYTLNNGIITFVSLGATESAIIWIAAQIS